MKQSVLQVFNGPPENSRDHIMAGARALLKGEWKKCLDPICALKVWDQFPEPKAVRAMVGTRIKEEGLRTYMLSFGAHYDSLSQTELAKKFELSENDVHSIVSKMIINEKLGLSRSSPRLFSSSSLQLFWILNMWLVTTGF